MLCKMTHSDSKNCIHTSIFSKRKKKNLLYDIKTKSKPADVRQCLSGRDISKDLSISYNIALHTFPILLYDIESICL